MWSLVSQTRGLLSLPKRRVAIESPISYQGALHIVFEGLSGLVRLRTTRTQTTHTHMGGRARFQTLCIVKSLDCSTPKKESDLAAGERLGQTWRPYLPGSGSLSTYLDPAGCSMSKLEEGPEGRDPAQQFSNGIPPPYRGRPSSLTWGAQKYSRNLILASPPAQWDQEARMSELRYVRLPQVAI